MNKKDFSNYLAIANKMEWMHKPLKMVIETINYMVTELQCKTIALTGDCKNIEDTLSEIATFNKKRLFELKRRARKIQIDWDE